MQTTLGLLGAALIGLPRLAASHSTNIARALDEAGAICSLAACMMAVVTAAVSRRPLTRLRRRAELPRHAAIDGQDEDRRSRGEVLIDGVPEWNGWLTLLLAAAGVMATGEAAARIDGASLACAAAVCVATLAAPPPHQTTAPALFASPARTVRFTVSLLLWQAYLVGSAAEAESTGSSSLDQLVAALDWLVPLGAAASAPLLGMLPPPRRTGLAGGGPQQVRGLSLGQAVAAVFWAGLLYQSYALVVASPALDAMQASVKARWVASGLMIGVSTAIALVTVMLSGSATAMAAVVGYAAAAAGLAAGTLAAHQ
ncbi:uncharacterized protein AMSG_09926 [Thecamonas trahens ATCC 50062]|uniref:Uncharacterized protein n=1 Tax=Thecamonas trahens ATCC 50062 TaxID=461836 RepID=A0A0L0DPC2_THETB|nr:hypothetical protein AMSG_09926 [Thecamonas trahens ATCC 50062]KNC54147.1 hypothetical protein AMSG_09926 [Thecamonas trahens ATCC 50062]|eukprot:XP_013753968.1 hypothetical protein AMSG_09926 [Thecamonas trahens ATCC 50062]